MLVVASIRHAVLALGITVAAGAGLLLSAAAHAKVPVKVNNQTGHKVTGYLFTDGKVHTSGDGGTSFGQLADGDTVAVDLPSCNFQILLVDGTENWHSEFKDCEKTHITIYADSGRNPDKKP